MTSSTTNRLRDGLRFTRSSGFGIVAASGLGLLVLSGCTGQEAADATAAQTVEPASTTASQTAGNAASAPSADLPQMQGEVDVAVLMADQALPDVVIGKAEAPITIVEYASMTCDHCAAFHVNTYPTLKRDWIDTGKAKLILREFPFDPRATAAFMLARCAPNDNRQAMIDVLFQKGEDWAHADDASAKLLSISKLAGFTEASFKACLEDKDLQAKVVKVKERGETVMGVNSTPTFFVNGKKYIGALKPEQMSALLDSLS